MKLKYPKIYIYKYKISIYLIMEKSEENPLIEEDQQH